MDESAASLVANRELLVEAMGHWPSFHDAHVLSASIDGDCCKAILHVFQMTDQVDEQGYFVLTKHHRVLFTMTGVSKCSLPKDYQGDTLFGMSIERSGEAVTVAFDSACCPGNSWAVTCREVALSEVAPCGPRGEAIS